jgi:hypothetical protein
VRFVVPGETAAVLGGVAASLGHASLAAPSRRYCPTWPDYWLPPWSAIGTGLITPLAFAPWPPPAHLSGSGHRAAGAADTNTIVG